MAPPACFSSVDHPNQSSSTISSQYPYQHYTYPQLHCSHTYGRLFLGGPTCYENRRLGSSCREDRTTMFGDRDSHDSSSARKRIAVACGRCRKRKIRCSGDSGLGEPCTNCRNAGHEPCQFLRVSSTETLMRPDNTNPYSNNDEHARQLGDRTSSILNPVSSSTSPYSDPVSFNTADSAVPMRSGLTYSYGSRPYYAGSHSVSQYPEEPGVDYQLYPQGYHQLSDPNYMVGYRVGVSTNRPGGGMFVESPPGFDYSSPTSSSSLIHRSSSSADSSFSFPSMASSLPGSVPANDRLLRGSVYPLAGNSSSRHYADDSIPYIKRDEPPSDSSSDSVTYASGEAVSGHYTSSSAIPSAAACTTGHISRGGEFDADTVLGSQPDMTYRYYDTTRRPGAPNTAGASSTGLGSSSSSSSAQAYFASSSQQDGPAYLMGVNGGSSGGERIGDDGKALSRYRH